MAYAALQCPITFGCVLCNVKSGNVQGKRLSKSLVETLLGNYSRVFRSRNGPLGSQNELLRGLQCVLRLAQSVLRLAQGVLRLEQRLLAPGD
jgi:hypothetical protein